MPLPWVVDGIWKEAKSSRMKEEDVEFWVLESKMREHESTYEILSPFTRSHGA
jgi:hypothetical protein